MYVSPENTYPNFIGDILLQNPEWMEGDPLPAGWHKVIEVNPPDISKDEHIEESFPQIVNAQYTQSFLVRPLTEEEINFRDAPKTAREKLKALGLTELEVEAIFFRRA
jgi:hypothetical protein